MNENRLNQRKWFVLFVLCLGGGGVYLLPYLRYSYYDPLIAALDLTHTQFGNLMAIFGVVNIPSYFLGGLIADRVPARLLVSLSLVTTGAAAFYYSTFPGYTGALAVHVVWSVTTILTYWAAMMKAVKLLGDSSQQGKLFGLRESGFGLMALFYSLLGLALFSASDNELSGLRTLIIFYGVTLVISGIISFVAIPESRARARITKRIGRAHLLAVLKIPGIWLAALVIFCVYSISIGLGYLTPYMSDVLEVDASLAALLASIRTYGIAVFGGALGGWIVDRIHSSLKYLIVTFLCMIGLVVVLIVTPGIPDLLYLIAPVMLLIAGAVYTMKGVYFVLVDELEVDALHVGVAVGLLSLIGFLPDAFIFTCFGALLDSYPGEWGYKLIFATMTGLSIAGLIASLLLFRIRDRAERT